MIQKKTAKRIHVGPANKVPLKKLINVYLYPPNVRAPVTTAGRLREVRMIHSLGSHRLPQLSLCGPPGSGTRFETMMGELTPQSMCLVVTTDFSLFVEKSGADPLLPYQGPLLGSQPRGLRHTSCCRYATPTSQHLGAQPALLTFQEKMHITNCGSVWGLRVQQLRCIA